MEKSLVVVVIGAGVIGTSVAYSLAQRGFEVVVCDGLKQAGHGSTSSSSAIVRCFYSVPEMIALAHEGSAIWRNWADFIGPTGEQPIRFETTGMLFVPERLDAGVLAIVAAMQARGIAAEVLDAGALRKRFPMLNTARLGPPRAPLDPLFFEESTEPVQGAVYERDAGYVVSPLLAVQNLRLAAEREGARFAMGRAVRSIEAGHGRRFRVLLANGDPIDCDAVVNAAGPHSGVINGLAKVRLPLPTRPLRQEVHRLVNPLSEASEFRIPALADLQSGFYSRPDIAGRSLFVGSTEPECDELEWIEDPDQFDRNITHRWWERQSLRLMRRLPVVGRGAASGHAALYDVSLADWYPIVDRTDVPGFYVCIGTSGSSFKTSPVLGRLLAEIIEHEFKGGNQDTDPIRFRLPLTGGEVNGGFLSRHRRPLAGTGTVIG